MGTITAWSNFSKRRNSTKQPTGAGTTLTGTLKDDTSLANPVFVLSGDNWAYNYIQYAGQYYFVDDVVSLHNGLTEFHCSKDVLATYKTQIQASSPFVLYYTHNNTEITDSRLSMKTTQVTASNTGSFDFLGAGYAYVTSIVGEDSIAYYALSESEVRDLFGRTFSDNFDDTVYDIPDVQGTGWDAFVDWCRWTKEFTMSTAGCFNYSGSVCESVKNCVIIPFTRGHIGGTPNTQINIGRIDTGLRTWLITDQYRIATDSADVTIPWPSGISDWRRNAPYTELYLYSPIFGLVDISPSDVMGETTLTIDLSVDVFNGDSIVVVSTPTKQVKFFTTNIGTQYAVGSAPISPKQLMTNLVSAAASIASEGFAGVGNACLGIANAVQPSPSCIGCNGGGAILGVNPEDIICFSVFHDTTVTPSSVSATIGTPYNGILSLSGVSGYVQTANASIDIPGFGGDKDAVNNYLNGGIYIE